GRAWADIAAKLVGRCLGFLGVPEGNLHVDPRLAANEQLDEFEAYETKAAIERGMNRGVPRRLMRSQLSQQLANNLQDLLFKERWFNVCGWAGHPSSVLGVRRQVLGAEPLRNPAA